MEVEPARINYVDTNPKNGFNPVAKGYISLTLPLPATDRARQRLDYAACPKYSAD